MGKDHRLRGGWQIAICFLAYYVSIFLIQTVFAVIIQGLGIEVTEIVSIVFQVVLYFLLIGMLVLLFTKLNGSSIRVLGYDSVKNSRHEFLVGSAAAIISMTILAVLSYITGDYHIVSVKFSPMIIAYLVFFTGVGFFEETLSRGFLQQTILIRWGMVAALLLPSLLFAFLHLGNANVSILAIINTALAGIIFGLFAIRYDNIAASIGYHIFWNFFQGNIFGVSVSGTAGTASLIQVVRDRDTVWTGGAYGLEGGLICSIVQVIIIVLQIRFIKQRPVNAEFAELTKKAEPRFPFDPQGTE